MPKFKYLNTKVEASGGERFIRKKKLNPVQMFTGLSTDCSIMRRGAILWAFPGCWRT